MTSTDSSASNSNNNQNNSSTSESAIETNSKTMINENESQVQETQEVKDNIYSNNISSSDASSSPSSSSPASSSPASSKDSSADKVQTQVEKSPKETKSTNQKTNNHSKKASSNQNQNSIEHSPITSSTISNHQQHQQFVNYYPTYIPRQGQPPQNTVNAQAPPYTQIDANAPQSWPQAMAAAAAMAAMAANDPMTLAAYMNNGPNGVQNGVPAPYQSGNPADLSQQHYDQFSFGFTPAFGFGYTGNSSIDYAAIQAAQQGSNLNPQSNQWTPSTNSTATTANTGNPSNTTSSPANATTSSNDTTSSVPSTAISEASTTTNSNAKWVQVMQDPLAVHEFNSFQQQQLSPVDLYTPQHHHQPHHNYRSHQHHHYQRHQQHMQPNYHHYQYNNPYHIQHYQNQYANMQHPMQHHHYSHNTNKYNNYQKNKNNNNHNYNDNTGSNYQTHDNNNNSNKSNNLNNTDSTTKPVKQAVVDASIANQTGEEVTIGNTEAKSESGSKSWASIVGVSSSPSTTNTPTSTQQTSTGSSPTPTNEVAQQHQTYYPVSQNDNTNFNEYSNYIKPKNNYYKNYNKHSFDNSNMNSQSQVFDLTNRSFPPISANTETKAEFNENAKRSSFKKIETSHESNYNSNAQQFSQNSKKQQQYNNYQRQQQQQFNLPVGKYSQNFHNDTVNYSFNNNNKYNNVNGGEPSSQRSEKPYKGELSSYYYKRHQPSQPTLSSFLNIVDKSKFDDAKANSVSKNNSISTNNNTNQANENVDFLNQQNANIYIDPSQLTVYMNPSAYNPKEFNTSPKAARFFVIKSYSEDDIHRSIKYNIWCSTEHGNRRLDSAYFKGDGQVPVYLFFSVNGSGHFCGMAEMQSRVDYNKKTGVWAQDKWRGCFQVRWIYVKDVPNSLLRNIKLENNDNKPVTNSRDTQEIPYDKGRQVLKVFHTYNHSSSILDDFDHYERKQEEDKTLIKVSHNFEQIVTFAKDNTNMNTLNSQNPELTNDTQKSEIIKDESVQNSSQATTTMTNTTTSSSVTSSPSASSSSSTSSIDESKQQQTQKKLLEQPKNSQLVSSSS